MAPTVVEVRDSDHRSIFITFLGTFKDNQNIDLYYATIDDEYLFYYHAKDGSENGPKPGSNATKIIHAGVHYKDDSHRFFVYFTDEGKMQLLFTIEGQSEGEEESEEDTDFGEMDEILAIRAWHEEQQLNIL